MLTASQRDRILAHLEHGWKLPDSLLQELWEAYKALEQSVGQQARPYDSLQGSGFQHTEQSTAELHHSSS